MRYKVIILLFILITACELGTDIDFPATKELTVVEGKITDIDSIHSIKLSTSNNFSSSETPPPIEDAQVVLRAGNGRIIPFSHRSNGVYQSDIAYNGIPDEQYQLRIILSNGDSLYSNFELLNEVHEIDILTYDFYEGETELVPGELTTIYYPVIFAEDPANERNYYSWRIFRNDSIFSGPENLILYEDRFFSGFYKNEFTSFEFIANDKMTVEVNSLSLRAFDYLTQYKAQTTSLGTVSGIPPAILRGNITNISNPDQPVLGYFYASSTRRKEITINP